MEKKIEFKTDIGILEGILDHNSQEKAVVITHPHPLYGGNMENQVVHTIASVYKSKYYTTLRFNFRGVGGSSGTYDDGRGEQDDIEAAITFLQKMGISEIELAGYSFGTWIIHNLIKAKGLSHRIVMVAPPVDFMQFEPETDLSQLALVVAGDQDEFASTDSLQLQVKSWNPQTPLAIVRGADHFFSDHFADLATSLSEV